jgi:signal transduction histidine kinase
MNNPASAAQRSAMQLQKMFLQLQDSYRRMGEFNLTGKKLEKIMKLDRLASRWVKQPVDLSALERTDKELEIEEWLNSRGFENAGELAPSLVNMGCGQKELDALGEDFTAQQFSVIVNWLSYLYTIYSLLSEISLGTGRITEIVRALKTYTYMDRAPVQSVDVHEGLNNTLIILQNKLKGGVTVRREYAEDLPSIRAHGSELNQVWTNIIDNAIDAMSGQGTLVLRTRMENSWVTVEIEDNGPGIPGGIQTKIFDPFFTTKPPGEGSGLGLNISRNIIVQKHQGRVDVSSKPGKTCFTVRLPVEIDQD